MEKLLQIHNLTKIFGEGTINEKVAIKALTLELSGGDFLTVIGNNGAGKSTLLNGIAGTFPVDGGRIVLGGRDITKLPEYKRAKYIERRHELFRIFLKDIIKTDEHLVEEETEKLAHCISCHTAAKLEKFIENYMQKSTKGDGPFWLK